MATKKSKMQKELTELNDQRQALEAGIRSFDPHKKYNETPTPDEVKVKDGGRLLQFKFKEGNLVAAPTGWGWALNWRFRDLLQYWRAHSQKVLYSS